MITKRKNLRRSYLSRVMILPLLFLLFCAFAIKADRLDRPLKLMHPITVVIDAGHGGADGGATGLGGTVEKDISLGIALKIAQLAKDYQVNVILTRSIDELSGGSNDIRKSLEYRVELIGQSKADLFVSIHVNADTKNADNSGFDIYISDLNSPLKPKSVALGSLLSQSIKKDYAISGELKQRSQGVYVLKEAKVPAVLLECGYLTNKGDEAFISQSVNQERIARDILQGITQYGETIAGADGHPATTAELQALSSSQQAPVYIATDTVAPKPASKGKIYTKVEVESQYPGGATAWANYLNKHIHYPQEALNKEIQGDVVVQFIVDRDGSLSDIKAISGPKVLRAESVRVIKESGNWVPATEKNATVKCYKKQPIKYRLEPA